MKRKNRAISIAACIITIILVTSFGISTYLSKSIITIPPQQFNSQMIEKQLWGDFTAVLSWESTDESRDPSLAVGADGIVHVAWQDLTQYQASGPDYDIFYKKFIPGIGWTVTEVISYNLVDSSINPSLAVGADGMVHIAWTDYTAYGGSGSDIDIFYRRYEPGVGWTAIEVVSTESTKQAQCPSLAVGADGMVHIAWEDSTDYGFGPDLAIVYKRYEPGVGWTVTEVVSTESIGSYGSRNPSLAVGADGMVHIAWEDGMNYTGSGLDVDVFYKRYEPGVGWTVTEVVSTESTGDIDYPSLAVGADGMVHIAWRDSTNYGSGPDLDVFYKRYEPGVGWTAIEVVSTESTGGVNHIAQCEPSLAVGADGIVHIAWQENTDYGFNDLDQDIFCRQYIPWRGWTTTQIISTESSDNSLQPSLAIGPDGTAHIAWQDSTDFGWNDPDSDIFYKLYVQNPQSEPTDLNDLVEFPGVTRLYDLEGAEKAVKYTEIYNIVEGCQEFKDLIESRGWVFEENYTISIVKGTLNDQPFQGTLYFHWTEMTDIGIAGLLIAALMDDGGTFCIMIYGNQLPAEIISQVYGAHVIVNAMPYMFLKFHFWDEVHDKPYEWTHWWYEGDYHPDWFWVVYNCWRTYTQQYYSQYYYPPWWYIWHWIYWKHWHFSP